MRTMRLTAPAYHPECDQRRIACPARCQRGYVGDENGEARRCKRCDGAGYTWVRVVRIEGAGK